MEEGTLDIVMWTQRLSTGDFVNLLCLGQVDPSEFGTEPIQGMTIV